MFQYLPNYLSVAVFRHCSALFWPRSVVVHSLRDKVILSCLFAPLELWEVAGNALLFQLARGGISFSHPYEFPFPWRDVLRLPAGPMSARWNCADAMPAGLINLPVHSLSQRGVLLLWRECLIELHHLNESYSIKSLHLPFHLGASRTGRIGRLAQPSVSSEHGETTENPKTADFTVVSLRLQCRHIDSHRQKWTGQIDFVFGFTYHVQGEAKEWLVPFYVYKHKKVVYKTGYLIVWLNDFIQQIPSKYCCRQDCNNWDIIKTRQYPDTTSYITLVSVW